MKMQHYQNKKGSGTFGNFFILNSTRLHKGFTLVELMVTITVFVAVTMVVLINQNDFNSGVLLNNLAYDVALSTRQAQSYGINVRGRQTSDVTAMTSSVFPPYGVTFDLSRDKEFVFFADTYPAVNELGKIGNGRYDAGVAEQCAGSTSLQCSEFVERYKVQRGNFIKKLCVTQATNETCKSTGEAGTLTISFRRPNPDAIFSTTLVSGGSKISSARIVVGSPKGTERSVLIYETGQISVKE